ncbi:MAG: flagellar biosynthesis protein FlhF [Rhodocyclales bacterium]|nr:flagellar biosynthesis protein FlhF [Rhodocyclales bacterium]
MNVKRYFGSTAREALRALKEELGADAIVLSNRAVNGGVEILALPAEAAGVIQAHANASTPAPAAAPTPAPRSPAQQQRDVAAHAGVDDDEDDFRVSLSGRPHAQRPAFATGAGAASIRPFQPPRVDVAPRTRAVTPPAVESSRRAEVTDELEFDMPAPRARTMAAAPPVATVAAPNVAEERQYVQRADEREADKERVRSLQEANARLMDELTGIRGMIERQLAGFAWGEIKRNAPARAEIVGELLESGFAGPLARKLAEAVSDDASLEDARTAVRNMLARDMRAMSCDADLIDRGGVYAIVGPTGVGKTTTTAKIAARCVVRHGAEKLALITTDGYRIGAQEQLRIYGRILGVPVFPVRDASELRQTLAELRNKHMVLIDTVGMSQRDRMVAQQAAMLSGAGDVRRLLLLNSTSRGDTLDDVIGAYRGPDLAGCIFTKIDEAVSLAPVIGAAIAHELEVFYVTNGQRVPEDLHLPNRAYLLHRALRERDAGSPWKLRDDEAALMMAAAGAEH